MVLKDLVIDRALVNFFRPIARFALRRGVGIRGLIEALRVATVEAGEAELLQRDGVVNRNRLSVLTGLYRGDIERIQSQTKSGEISDELAVSPATRMLTVWESASAYKNRSGKPKLLTAGEFAKLASTVSKTVHSGSILNELVRSGSVQAVKKKFELVRASNALFHGHDKAYSMIADDIRRLFLAVEANLSKRDPTGELHHRTSFDNIYVDSIPEIRTWILTEGREFHRRIREFLSQYDQDLNPSPYADRSAGGKVAVTSFSFSSEMEA